LTNATIALAAAEADDSCGLMESHRSRSRAVRFDHFRTNSVRQEDVRLLCPRFVGAVNPDGD
jgi:hypothetical protein